MLVVIRAYSDEAQDVVDHAARVHLTIAGMLTVRHWLFMPSDEIGGDRGRSDEIEEDAALTGALSAGVLRFPF